MQPAEPAPQESAPARCQRLAGATQTDWSTAAQACLSPRAETRFLPSPSPYGSAWGGVATVRATRQGARAQRQAALRYRHAAPQDPRRTEPFEPSAAVEHPLSATTRPHNLWQKRLCEQMSRMKGVVKGRVKRNCYVSQHARHVDRIRTAPCGLRTARDPPCVLTPPIRLQNGNQGARQLQPRRCSAPHPKLGSAAPLLLPRN